MKATKLKESRAALDAVIVETIDGRFFRFALFADRMLIVQRKDAWKNYEDYRLMWDPDDIEGIRKEFFRFFKRFPSRQAGIAAISKAIWLHMYLIAEDRTETYSESSRPRDPVTGKKQRRRKKLNARTYRALINDNDTHLPAQALVVHRLLLARQEYVDKEWLTEAEVKSVMQDGADTKALKTKQDPFRIFQYYRGALIKARKLEMKK